MALKRGSWDVGGFIAWGMASNSVIRGLYISRLDPIQVFLRQAFIIFDDRQ